MIIESFVNKQGLYYQNKLAHGCVFFSKEGAVIYNNLIELMRKQYLVRGFEEVITPNLYNLNIFKISGHYQAYQDEMFMFKNEGCGLGLKPMNCPGHCILFKSQPRCYKDLPLRFAEFGIVHRDEMAGALCGLSRVRRFVQDDCHIFCAHDHIHQEIMNNLNFVKDVYSLFGFEYEFRLSTKPEKSKQLNSHIFLNVGIGGNEMWDKAEEQLKNALEEFGAPWSINEGDGAFLWTKN
jgi:threonyl-tRNA synthetase